MGHEDVTGVQGLEQRLQREAAFLYGRRRADRIEGRGQAVVGLQQFDDSSEFRIDDLEVRWAERRLDELEEAPGVLGDAPGDLLHNAGAAKIGLADPEDVGWASRSTVE